MNDQYVEVAFFEQRNVLVNGRHNGFTNKLIRIDEGEYTFSLEGDGFSPGEVTLYVENTTALEPLKIRFEGAAS